MCRPLKRVFGISEVEGVGWGNSAEGSSEVKVSRFSVSAGAGSVESVGSVVGAVKVASLEGRVLSWFVVSLTGNSFLVVGAGRAGCSVADWRR